MLNYSVPNYHPLFNLARNIKFGHKIFCSLKYLYGALHLCTGCWLGHCVCYMFHIKCCCRYGNKYTCKLYCSSSHIFSNSDSSEKSHQSKFVLAAASLSLARATDRRHLYISSTGFILFHRYCFQLPHSVTVLYI